MHAPGQRTGFTEFGEARRGIRGEVLKPRRGQPEPGCIEPRKSKSPLSRNPVIPQRIPQNETIRTRQPGPSAW